MSFSYRSEASSRLKTLWTSGWMHSSTRAIKLQFTLYSPVYNLFTTVTVLGEMSFMGAVLSSVFISSTRLHHSACALDYCTMAGEVGKQGQSYQAYLPDHITWCLEVNTVAGVIERVFISKVMFGVWWYIRYDGIQRYKKSESLK